MAVLAAVSAAYAIQTLIISIKGDRTRDQRNEKMMSELKGRSQRATLLAKVGELLQSCRTHEEVVPAAPRDFDASMISPSTQFNCDLSQLCNPPRL